MSPFSVPEGPYAIESVMDSIRTQVIEAEVWPEPDQEAAGTEIRPLVQDGSPVSAVMTNLELMRQRQPLQPDYSIRSHRPVLGIVTRLFKRIISWGARPHLEMLRQKQEGFNEAVLNCVREMALHLEGNRMSEAQLRQEFIREIGKLYDSVTSHYSFHANYEAIWQKLDEQINRVNEVIGLIDPNLVEHQTLLGHLQERYGSLLASISHIDLKHETLVKEFWEQIQELGRKQAEDVQHLSNTRALLDNLEARHQSGLEEVWRVNGAVVELQKKLDLLREDVQHLSNTRALLDNLDARHQSGLEEVWRVNGAVVELQKNLDQLRGEYEVSLKHAREFRRSFGRQIEGRAISHFFDQIPLERRRTALDQTRGSFEDITHRQAPYVAIFKGRPGRILDLGCGRGELLNLLRLEGIESWGAEIDEAMVAEARGHGVHVEQLDALTALASVPPASLGGVFAAQVVEHLYPGELLRVLMLARQQLAPGGVLVLETINASSPAAFAKSYTRDLDHKLPLHPEYLKLLLDLAGFDQVELHYTMPFQSDERIPPLPPVEKLGLSAEAYVALQERLSLLDRRVFGMQDFYVVGHQGEPAPPLQLTGVEPTELRL